ncbi:MAG: serine/threonine protein kinase [Planctomycetota bacterium]|nr:MAG: serine/threonine protein kinase [Planctomycetota bacterium]
MLPCAPASASTARPMVMKGVDAKGQYKGRRQAGDAVPALCSPAPEATPRQAREKVRIPRILGDFVLEKRIGKGGRSYVFAARQALLERTVALKVLRPEFAANPELVAAFQSEAAAYGRCDHPNILTCHAAGQDGDWHYMALSYAPHGDTIQALTGSSRRRSVHRVLKWMAQIAEAVDHLASQGWVHGDIKPGNILVGPDDRALLADLGSLHPLQDQGVPKRFEGTAAYMSPEQAARENLNVSSDIFAIGATAWHLCTGKAPRPFTNDKHEALRRAREEPLAPLSSMAPWVPSAAVAVIERCIQPDARQRYQRPEDLARMARQVLDSIRGDSSDTIYPAINFQQGF